MRKKGSNNCCVITLHKENYTDKLQITENIRRDAFFFYLQEKCAEEKHFYAFGCTLEGSLIEEALRLFFYPLFFEDRAE